MSYSPQHSPARGYNPPMPPEATVTPDAPQPAVEPSSPAVEVPTETPPAEPAQVAPKPESALAPVEAAPASETVQAPTPTAHIPPNEPIAPESDSTEHSPEPPSAAASTPTLVHPIRDLLNKARIAIQDRKRKKRDEIMLALTTKNKITNDSNPTE